MRKQKREEKKRFMQWYYHENPYCPVKAPSSPKKRTKQRKSRSPSSSPRSSNSKDNNTGKVKATWVAKPKEARIVKTKLAWVPKDKQSDKTSVVHSYKSALLSSPNCPEEERAPNV